MHFYTDEHLLLTKSTNTFNAQESDRLKDNLYIVQEDMRNINRTMITVKGTIADLNRDILKLVRRVEDLEIANTDQETKNNDLVRDILKLCGKFHDLEEENAETLENIKYLLAWKEAEDMMAESKRSFEKLADKQRKSLYQK